MITEPPNVIEGAFLKGLFFNELLLASGVVLPSGAGFTIGVRLGCA